MKEISLSWEQVDILTTMIMNEIEYYKSKEVLYEEEIEYVNELNEMLKKLD